jgi:hypothetical protein
MKKFASQNIFWLVLFSFLLPCTVISQPVDPYKFIATLQYDGCDFFDNGESNFPMPFRFNTTQDANSDGVIDVEDNLENLVLYSINDVVYGTGRTGLTGRGPNNQNPAIYFHFATTANYGVYEYWLYYADNNWINDHEHDWEKYFVYVHDTIPFSILISTHDSYNIYDWNDISSVQYHALIGIDGGSHAMKNSSEDGVSIDYDGNIFKNNGTLLTLDSINLPWILFSNDSNVINCINYIQSPDTFYYGDPSYVTNNNEWGDPRQAPWLRDEWNNPPEPVTGLISNNKDALFSCYPNPASDQLFIDLKNLKADCLMIYSSDGSLVFNKNTSLKNNETIDIRSFRKGIYFLKVCSEGKNIIKKIILI